MFEQRIVLAISASGSPLQPEALIAALFGDGASDEEMRQLRLDANQMLNNNKLVWVSGSGYYLLPPP